LAAFFLRYAPPGFSLFPLIFFEPPSLNLSFLPRSRPPFGPSLVVRQETPLFFVPGGLLFVFSTLPFLTYCVLTECLWHLLGFYFCGQPLHVFSRTFLRPTPPCINHNSEFDLRPFFFCFLALDLLQEVFSTLRFASGQNLLCQSGGPLSPSFKILPGVLRSI